MAKTKQKRIQILTQSEISELYSLSVCNQTDSEENFIVDDDINNPLYEQFQNMGIIEIMNFVHHNTGFLNAFKNFIKKRVYLIISSMIIFLMIVVFEHQIELIKFKSLIKHEHLAYY